MYKYPTSTLSPKQLLVNISEPSIQYNQFDQTVNVIGRVQKQSQIKLGSKRGRLLWEYRVWKVGGIGIEFCRIDFVGNGREIVHFIPVGAGIMAFWITSTPSKEQKEQLKSEPKPDQILIVQYKSNTNKLTIISQTTLPLSTINSSPIIQQSWFLVTKKISFHIPLNCLILEWSYQKKTHKILLGDGDDIIDVRLKWVLRVDYVVLGDLRKKQSQSLGTMKSEQSQVNVFTYYQGFRHLQKYFLILHPNKLAPPPPQQSPSTNSLSRSQPLILTYQPLPYAPNRLSLIQSDQRIHLKLTQLQNHTLKWPTTNQIIRDIVIDGYLLGLDNEQLVNEDEDEEQDNVNNDVGQMVSWIVEQTSAHCKETGEFVEPDQTILLIYTVYESMGKLLRVDLNLINSSCKVINIMSQKLPSRKYAILHMEYCRGYLYSISNSHNNSQNILTYLPINTETYKINENDKIQQIVTQVQMGSCWLGSRPIMVCDQFMRLRIIGTRLCSNSVQQWEGQQQSLCVSVIEMAHKKLLYIKLLQLFLGKQICPQNGSHEQNLLQQEQVQADTHLAQTIAKYTLPML